MTPYDKVSARERAAFAMQFLTDNKPDVGCGSWLTPDELRLVEDTLRSAALRELRDIVECASDEEAETRMARFEDACVLRNAVWPRDPNECHVNMSFRFRQVLVMAWVRKHFPHD